MRKGMICAVAVTALATCAFAQQLAETIEVRVTNVDVVVTDKAGHPIHSLTRDDFELFENGKLQPLTNFYEIRAEAPVDVGPTLSRPTGESAPREPVVPAEMRQRSIIVFIDNSSIEPGRRNLAIEAIDRALDTLLRPGDDAMLVAWNRHSEVLQQFTSDRAALKRALGDSRKRLASAGTLGAQKNQVISYAQNALTTARAMRGGSVAKAYEDSASAARSYAEWVHDTERVLLQSVSQTISMLSGIEGKKVLVFVGGELEEHPGLDVFQTIDSMYMSAGVRNMMPAVLRESDRNMTDDLSKLARNANANGVTMYMIDVLDRSKNASNDMPDQEADFLAEANSFLSMGMLASNTGGTVLSGTRNFSVALDNIARDLGSYYSLGYKPPASGGVDRRISVKVKRPGAVVRMRHSYALKTADEQIEDRVIANAFHSSLKSEFPVTIATAPAEPFQKGLFRVKVTLTFPSTLTYLPDGDNLAGEYDVFFVTAAEDGTLSPVARQVQQVKFPASAANQVKQKPFTHTAGLVVRPGKQMISVVVLDRLGARSGLARTTITVR